MNKWQYKGNVAPPEASKEVKGLWNEYINQDGESTVKQHELKTVWESCPPGECYFVLDNPRTRTCTCKKCGCHAAFVLGMQTLVDGEIISLR